MKKILLTASELDVLTIVRTATQKGFTVEFSADEDETVITLKKSNKKDRVFESILKQPVFSEEEKVQVANAFGRVEVEPVKSQEPEIVGPSIEELPEEEEKPIEVPRDWQAGNAKLAQMATKKGKTSLFQRCHTEKHIQGIDKNWKFPEVMNLVRLRTKKEFPSPEDSHAVKVVSQQMGVGDFRGFTPSLKEWVCILKDVKLELEKAHVRASVEKIIEVVLNKYEVANLKVSYLRNHLYQLIRWVLPSPIAQKFFDGENVNMNFSVNYFKQSMEE